MGLTKYNVVTMGKPKGSIGETKLKILAIINHNNHSGIPSYGYGLWKTLEKKYYCCLGKHGLRNVYHHLNDLQNIGLITKNQDQNLNGSTERHSYYLTKKSKEIQEKFKRYLEPLQ
jgi:DNA-binding PadR family transcriptional regulator